MSTENTLTAFYRLFQGNPAFYVHHQAPFVEKEGKLKASWCGFAAYGTKSFPNIPEGFEKGDLVPVTKEHYREHLNGGNGVAIAPLCNTKDKNNVCYFAAIDIDVYDTTFTGLVRKLYKFGFKFAAFRSKSGGLHLYFFFSEAEPGGKVIEALNKIVEVFGLNRLYVNDKNKSKVEVFPKQATFIPGDRNVNCLFLPFYNTAKGCKNKMFTAEGKLIGIEKAIPIIESMFTSVREIRGALENLPYSDAPFCIQMILLTGALAENDGRNCFLFSAAIYLKKKYREDFRGLLDEMNGCLEAPLEEKEVTSIYSSVTDKEKNWDNYWCKKSPCADYCDKRLCKQREFGVGRDKGNHLTGADSWGELTKVVDTADEAQYYIWQIRVKEGEDYRPVRIDCVDDFENQAKIRTACRRDLHWSPNVVKQADWIDITNRSMDGLKERKIVVAKGTETSEDSLLRNAVMRYLTHKQIQNGQQSLIKVGQVYKSDGVYYFTTDGLLRFLNLEKIPLHKVNLHAKLTDFGCTEAELVYKTAKGVEIKIPCWKKSETEELLAMDAFYDDIYEGDADILQKNKAEEEDGSGDDTKF